MTPLGRLIEHLYGLPPGPLDGPDVYDRAMRSYTASRSYDQPVHGELLRRYGGRADVFRAALEQSAAYSADVSDIFGFLVNAVLVAVPFRHESVWVEVEPPYTVWHQDAGWRPLRASLDDSEEQGPPFVARMRRACWLHALLPGYGQFMGPGQPGRSTAQDDAHRLRRACEVWLSDLGAISPADIEATWSASGRRGSADALFALWGAFFLDAPGLLIDVLDATVDHPSAVVRSAREVVHEAQWGKTSDWLFDHVRSQRKAFGAQVAGRPGPPDLDPSRAALGRRLPGGLPARVRPEIAFQPADLERFGVAGGWTLHASTASGLTAREAAAIVEAAGAAGPPVVGLASDGRGEAVSEVGRLIYRRAFAPIRSLSIGQAPLGGIAHALAGSEHATGLVAVGASRLYASDLETLGKSSLRLKRLWITDDGRVDPKGFYHLSEARAFAALEELSLPSPHCQDKGILVWVASGRTRHLRRLAMRNGYSGADVHRMREQGAHALLTSELPRLEHLDLKDHSVGDRALAAFADNPRAGELRHLGLEGTGVTAPGVAALARSPRLRRLEVLDLHRTGVDASGVRAIAQSPHLTKLRWLRLFAVDDEGAAALSEARFDQLATLDLERNPHYEHGKIGDAGVTALAQAPWLAAVRVLLLTGNPVGPEGARALAASPFAQGLEQLDLSHGSVGEAGVQALLSLPRLKRLSVYFCGVPRQATEALQKLRPDVALTIA